MFKKYFALILSMSLMLVTEVYGQIPSFQDNDRICFIGSSIAMNGGNYHYINLFYATRYPDRNITFLNCGISGDWTDNILARIHSDVFVVKPTWAVLMLEENDLRPSLYMKDRQNEAGIQEKKQERIESWCRNADSIVRLLMQAKVKVILQTPTIYDQTGQLPSENAYGVNDALKKCVEFLKQLSGKYQLPLVDCWTVMNEDNRIIQKKDPTKSIIGNDRVHVSKLGFFVMAHTFLNNQDIEKKVSYVKVNVKKNSTLLAENCIISNLQAGTNDVSFEYLSRSLPFPSPDGLNPDSLHPFTSELNKEVLQIKGLKRGNYNLLIDSSFIGTYSNKDLSKGINLSLNTATPQSKQSQKVLDQFYEYWKTERQLRLLKYVEYQHFEGATVMVADMDLVKAKFDSILNENKTSENYNFFKKVFAEYLSDKVNEKDMEQKHAALFQSIYKLNKPVKHFIRINKK